MHPGASLCQPNKGQKGKLKVPCIQRASQATSHGQPRRPPRRHSWARDLWVCTRRSASTCMRWRRVISIAGFALHGRRSVVASSYTTTTGARERATNVWCIKGKGHGVTDGLRELLTRSSLMMLLREHYALFEISGFFFFSWIMD